MASKRDYYEVLGLSKTASETDIKSAYRKMALQYHPDRNKAKDAEEKFKEINEAYQVLSDKQKRQTYDQFGHAAFDPSIGGSPNGAGGNPFAGGFGGGYTWSSAGGGNPFGNVDFGDPFDIFEAFFGGSMGGRARAARVPNYSMRISFDEAARGATKEVEIEGKRQTIKIPAGVDDGTRIKFKNFSVTFDVATDPYFKRQGADLFVDHPVKLSTLLTGGVEGVKSLNGKIKLKVREGTQSGTTVRLRGEGLPRLQYSGNGDMYVRLVADLPARLNREQRKAVEALQKAGL